jgi:two-component system cell cycle response regulator DivK
MATNEPRIQQQQGKRILIVDDSEDMRILLEQILEEESYVLQFAENGQQALESAKHFRPDLILLDMSLPGLSGWEVVPQLRLLPEFAHTPIIAVTAHVSKADQERSLALGCTAHLGKPFDIAAVLDMITDILENPSGNSSR